MKVKLRSGRFLVPVEIIKSDGRIFFKFRYNKKLMEEIKILEGARYSGYEGAPYRDFVKQIFGTDKIWSIKDTPHNRFQLEYLKGGNPYKRWDKELIDLDFERPLREHQKEAIRHILTRKQCIIAYEMGAGKTLSAIEAMERIGGTWWWVGPRSAIRAVEAELEKWDSKIIPKIMTYNGLVKEMENWSGGAAPNGVVFDECQKIKTPTALRSQAAKALADGVREDHDGYVVLMSGTPAPKNPADWWHLCEVARPGFLKEGSYNKMKFRLGVFKEQESFTGGTFNKLIAWKDGIRCAECGHEKNHYNHAYSNLQRHDFIKMENEVSKLYRRMQGLTIVKFLKDCGDIPEFQYRTIKCTPSPSIIRTAKLIASQNRAAQALILLRELSDGFQYQQVEDGEKPCDVCNAWRPEGNCPGCGGAGKVPKFKRVMQEYPCPKDQVLKDILGEHWDIKRLVVYAAFQGSVDKCVRIAQSEGWTTWRWDGRGQEGPDDPYKLFQSDSDIRVCFIGQPGAAGTGLNLTNSPSIFYYSNDFNAENRWQSQARIRRLNSRGTNVIDVVHLPSDQLVIDNLKQKRNLQNMTMGELHDTLCES